MKLGRDYRALFLLRPKKRKKYFVKNAENMEEIPSKDEMNDRKQR
jgi:hypothetical protein